MLSKQFSLEELIIVRELWLETAQKKREKLPDVQEAIAKEKAMAIIKITINY